EWKAPQWFGNAVHLDKGWREKHARKFVPEPNSALDALDEWVAYFEKTDRTRPHGITLANGKADKDQVEGWLILKIVGPARLPNKKVERRVRNTPMHQICAFFSERAAEYFGKVAALGGSISAMWQPAPLEHPENFDFDAFLKHAVHCGVSRKMAEGPIHAFAEQWMQDHRENLDHGVGGTGA
ncbi:hypothetical protein PUNSTDRAFT_136598, partial [Punctularia strigosozonata HHB-11173 SS5]|uniref:uncharacterized protein n=1 Tax=Punctularia strigosozonata (strain HHB-11173) TaxID=741275 RepID=UPI0004418415